MVKKGVYIHIPFCMKKCAYCDFLSFEGTKIEKKEAYITALIQEMDYQKINSISTLYIGGGTPSILPIHLFIKMMDAIKKKFHLDREGEATIEVNPGVVTKEQLATYKAYGINRISIGLQSTEDHLLEKLGRIHTYSEFLETYSQVREAGFSNVSIDLMFGLSEQTLEQWQETLETIIGLRPEHISAYSLIIEPDTPYERWYNKGELSLPSDQLERAMFWYAHDRLEAAGYNHYEISNYALPNKEGQHNSSYWTLTPYIGLGLGGASYLQGVRYKNSTHLQAYIEAEGNLEEIRHIEQAKDLKLELEEAFFLGLRRMKGISLLAIEEKYGKEALEPYQPILQKLEGENWLIKEGDMVRVSRKGIDLSNQVLSQFILD